MPGINRLDTLTSLTTTAILFYQPNIHLIEQNNSNFRYHHHFYQRYFDSIRVKRLKYEKP